MPQILNITSIEDIERIKEAILNNETFELGEVKPIPFKLKLTGGRFENYNPKFIDKFVARAVLAEQENYERVLKEIEKLYNVRIPAELKVLQFELEKGSLELLTELVGLAEVLKNMESIHQLYAVLGIAGGWFSYLGFSKFLDSRKNELEVKSREVMQKLHGEEQSRYLDTINKTVEALKDVSNNSNLQKAINKPKQDIANMLEDDESLGINDDTQNRIRRSNTNNFDFVAPVTEDIEEEIIDSYTIDNYQFRSPEKNFKLSGISKEINSLPISAEKRIKIITKAEAQESVKLKLKFIKDGLTNKIKQAFILDYIEN
jgi:hypothetical protein